MYQLKAKNSSGEIVVLDNEIPDDFAEQHDAVYCGQFWPQYTNFELVKIPEVSNEEKI